jgi:hypothetical protein
MKESRHETPEVEQVRKGTALLASLGLLVGMLVFPIGAGAKCAPDRWAIYENYNFGGHSWFDCVSQNDFRDLEWGVFAWEDFEDAVSSIKTFSQWARFYDGINYATPLAYYIANTSTNVGANYNDRFSSVWNGFN